jgi:hypothetical protein
MTPEKDLNQSFPPAPTEGLSPNPKIKNLQTLANEYHLVWRTNPGTICSCLEPFALLDPEKYKTMLEETKNTEGFGEIKINAALSLKTFIKIHPDIGIPLFDQLDKDKFHSYFNQGLDLVFPTVIEMTNSEDAAQRIKNSSNSIVRVAHALGVGALKASKDNPDGNLAKEVKNAYNEILKSRISLSGARQLAAERLDELVDLDPQPAKTFLKKISEQSIIPITEIAQSAIGGIISDSVEGDSDLVIDNPEDPVILHAALSLLKGRFTKECYVAYKNIINYRLFNPRLYAIGCEFSAQTTFANSLGLSENPEDIQLLKNAILRNEHFIVLGAAKALGNLAWADKNIVTDLCDTFLKQMRYFDSTDLLPAFYGSSKKLMAIIPDYFWNLYQLPADKINKVENLLPHIANYNLEHGLRAEELTDEYSKLLHNPNIDIASKAAKEIGVFAKNYPEIYLQLLEEAANYTPPPTRNNQVAANAYSTLGSLALSHPDINNLENYYQQALNHPLWMVKLSVTEAMPGLLAVHPEVGIRLLKPLLNDRNPAIKQAAQKAIVDGMNIVLNSIIEEKEKLFQSQVKLDVKTPIPEEKINPLPEEKHFNFRSIFPRFSRKT